MGTALEWRGRPLNEEGKIVSRKNQRYLIVVILCVVVVLLAIEYIGMLTNARLQANQTADVLISQVKSVMRNNAKKEQALIDSLKEEYIAKAKAVSYIIDQTPQIENDIAELIRIAKLMSIDEIHIFDESGTIYAGTLPPYYGFSFDTGEQIAFFRPMLQNKALSMCQDVTPNTSEGRSMMYAICWSDGGERMVQVGIEPRRLIQELQSNEISEIIDAMPAYEGTEIMAVDPESGEILGATTSRRIGTTLKNLGIDLADRDLSGNNYFKAKVNGKNSYCAASESRSYIIVVAQECAVVNRNIPVVILSVLLYLMIAAAVIALIVRQMTRRIMEEKRNANTDAMTGFFNKRAYENDVGAWGGGPYGNDFVFVSADLNALKATNDTYGHDAGDELIRGAAQCLKQCFGGYGRLYRVGGDEFAALLSCDEVQMQRACREVEQTTEDWSQSHKWRLAISIGCVRAEEFPEEAIPALAKKADERMYAAKTAYYRAAGIDRRSHVDRRRHPDTLADRPEDKPKDKAENKPEDKTQNE